MIIRWQQPDMTAQLRNSAYCSTIYTTQHLGCARCLFHNTIMLSTLRFAFALVKHILKKKDVLPIWRSKELNCWFKWYMHIRNARSKTRRQCSFVFVTLSLHFRCAWGRKGRHNVLFQILCICSATWNAGRFSKQLLVSMSRLNQVHLHLRCRV